MARALLLCIGDFEEECEEHEEARSHKIVTLVLE
jgi:hypothetical protein